MDRQLRICLELEDYFKDSQLRPSEGDFFQQYRIIDDIGYNTYGTFSKAVKLSNEEEEVLVRIVQKTHARKITVGQRTLPVEALALHKLQSVEGVGKFLEFFESKSRFFYVLESQPEYLDLLDFFDLDKGRHLAERRVKHIFNWVAKSVASLKQRGLIRGNVKSVKVNVDLEMMEAILIDFGSVDVAMSLASMKRRALIHGDIKKVNVIVDLNTLSDLFL